MVQALSGVKVLDFGWAQAGTVSTKQLADHGATVIKVESMNRLDGMRNSRQVAVSSATSPDDKPYFTHFNTSKFSFAIDLKHSQSREIMNKLIRWADVINENFSPGTMKKLGYDYQYLCSIKPDIIMVSASIFGQIGPLGRESGVDGIGNSASGRLNLAGWPDRSPVMPSAGTYLDAVLPLMAAIAVISALDYRNRTGKGQYIDTAQIEVGANQILPAVLDWQANKNLQTRSGNRAPDASPHGVFPCQGNDRWCAIAVFTQAQWLSLCDVIGNPQWTKEIRFLDLESRKQNEDELERLVGEWTSRYKAEEVMQLMQKTGVPAGVVQTAQDIVDNDPQLKHRGFFRTIKHPVLGTFMHPGPPYQLLNTVADVKTSPCLGEHNEYICTNLLGMSEKEYIELLMDGVFT